MKKITFGSEEPRVNQDMVALKSAIVEFLGNNGMPLTKAQEYVDIVGKTIELKFNCTNNDYTKAIGLCILLFTEHNKEAFLAFRPYGIQINVRFSSNINRLITYIRDRKHVSIEY